MSMDWYKMPNSHKPAWNREIQGHKHNLRVIKKPDGFQSRFIQAKPHVVKILGTHPTEAAAKASADKWYANQTEFKL